MRDIEGANIGYGDLFACPITAVGHLVGDAAIVDSNLAGAVNRGRGGFPGNVGRGFGEDEFGVTLFHIEPEHRVSCAEVVAGFWHVHCLVQAVIVGKASVPLIVSKTLERSGKTHMCAMYSSSYTDGFVLSPCGQKCSIFDMETLVPIIRTA